MARRTRRTSLDDMPVVLLEIWAVNVHTNQLLLEHLDPRAWRAEPPGSRSRTMAAIFSHVHNIRRKWLRLSASHLGLPAELDHRRVTQRQARTALAQSGQACSRMLAEAFGDGRVETFHRDAWFRPWPAGAAMFAYMFAHEAHHRGQALMLAHQLGLPLPSAIASQVWHWEKLWKDSGFETRPR
jgi:uncharacterized damage-inducible protein DinB